MTTFSEKYGTATLIGSLIPYILVALLLYSCVSSYNEVFNDDKVETDRVETIITEENYDH